MKPLDMVLTPMGLRFKGITYPCTIGRGGLSTRKAEGDGATPIGTHRIVGMLYRPDRMARPANWAKPIGPNDLWSDDVKDLDYNMLVQAPHAFSHETLRRADPMYDLILLTDWNWPYAVKGRGSAIFIHQWRGRGRPTAGCIGLRRDHLRSIAPQIDFSTRLVVPDLSVFASK
jgi:L,D-peptidoglycan transpeptidase YkuD (ErfK/YbiS/YcfS/YnhG family)